MRLRFDHMLRSMMPVALVTITLAWLPARARAQATAEPPQTVQANQPAVIATLKTIDPDDAGTPTPASTLAPPETILSKPTESPTPAPLDARAEPASPETAAAKPAEDSSGESSNDEEKKEDSAEPLQPIPDHNLDHQIKVETASFNGVTPGETTVADLQTAWGPPKQMTNQGGQIVHLYAVDPFQRVEVTIDKEKVASIVIRLDHILPAKLLAEQLQLANIRPVLVSNELGEILGQSYPERGVLFAFEPADGPGKATMRVVDIVIEPVSAESFVLRAETYLDSHLEQSAADLETAIKLDPNSARAFWLHARVLAALGDLAKAVDAATEAVRLSPDDPQYQVTRAQILGQASRFEDAIRQAASAVKASDQRLHIKARALCLLGDLMGSGAQPDYQRGVQFQMEAVKTADQLTANPHPAVRLAAKEVLIDAHLGAAHNIAWGSWKDKQPAVTKWLDRAEAFAEDFIENDGGSEVLRFRVATRALAAYVGAQGELDPTKWTEKAVKFGNQLIASADDPVRKRQLQWELGLALYDAVQIYQMREEHEAALRYGQEAIGYLEQGLRRQHHAADEYLLGRLYFRMGAIYAVGRDDHAAAVKWFDKAAPQFESSASHLADHEIGRLGETFVSMGVSYWEVDQKDRAVKLTERGVELIQQAVAKKMLDSSALEVPYNNLATMHQQLGQEDQAKKYVELAARGKTSPKR